MIDVQTGIELGHYRVLDFVGRGGMGVVYRAEHLHLGRQVAIKVLAPELAENESFRERFIRESRLAAAVDHPNVIPIYEADEVDGTYFIAMRFVDGLDLREFLRTRGVLDLSRTMSMLGQVAGALDAAHEKGLVHRDVKPGNVLVVGDGEHCYLTDFGLTKSVSSNTDFTATGKFVGTADYVAPEQIEGKPLDRRTDVYSLGCVFYECLAGVPPFKRETDMAVMWAHVQEARPRISDRRPELPASLDAVIATAMARSKEERYPTCSAFAAAVHAAVEIETGERHSVTSSQSHPKTPVEPVFSVPALEQSGARTRPEDMLTPPPPVVHHAPPPQERGSSRTITAVAIVVAALLLVAGGLGAALIVTKGKKSDRAVTSSAVTPPAKTAKPKGTAPKKPSTPHRVVPVTPPPTRPKGPSIAEQSQGAEAAINSYWDDIAANDFDGAYGYYASTAAAGGAGHDSWVSQEEQQGIADVEHEFAMSGVGDGHATANVVRLVTRDANCGTRHWSGSYDMVESGGNWMIEQVNLTPSRQC